MLEMIIAGLMGFFYTGVLLMIAALVIGLVAPGKIEIVDKIYEAVFKIDFSDDEEL